jgi:hypothetical protein
MRADFPEVAWTAYEQHRTASRIHELFTTAFKQSLQRPSWWRLLDALQNWLSPERTFNPRTHKDLNTEANELDELFKPDQGRKNQWTTTHSHYAAMGGFAIDYRDSELEFAPPDHPRLVFTEKGLKFLAEKEKDLIPDLSKQQILDKSNTSGLGKFIVCIQATWFCVQFAFRISKNLSISLLELNTFGHALCTLLIYWLWWDKPVDIEEPTLLAGPRHRKLSAFLFINHFPPEKPLIAKEGAAKKEIDTPKVRFEYNWPFRCDNIQFTGFTLRMRELYQKAKNEPNQPPLKPHYIRIYRGQVIHDFTLSPYLDDSRYFLHVDLSPGEYHALMLANEARLHYGDIDISAFYKSPILDSRIVKNRIHNQSILTSRMIFFPDISLRAGFLFAGLIYGGLHLTAWDAPFPTSVETVLWRVSASVITCSGFAYLFMVHFLDIQALELYCTGTPRREIKQKFLRAILVMEKETRIAMWYMALPTLGLYCFARVYLVVECFLSLAYLPNSTFLVPSWSQYVPHIV